MENKVIALNEMKLRLNKNKLHQTDVRAYKEELHLLFMEKFNELGYDVTLVENGFIIEVPHDELGAIPIEAKFVIKPIDYDVISAGEQYEQKIAAKAEKERERKAQAR